jgi:hypothetical protein
MLERLVPRKASIPALSVHVGNSGYAPIDDGAVCLSH